MNKTLLPSIFLKSLLGVLFFVLFSFKLSARDYYINDNDLTSDVYCTAVGIVSNDGLSAATPKNSITSVLNAYGPSGDNTIASGDVFYIDAGLYYVVDVALGLNIDNISFIGAGSELTLFDNGPCGSCSGAFFLNIYNTAFNTVVQGMTLTNYIDGPGADGKAISVYGAVGVVIDDVNMISNFTQGAAAFYIGSNSQVIFRNGASSCNQGQYGGGIEIEGSDIDVLIQNCVVANNSKTGIDGAGIWIIGSSNVNVQIENSIIADNIAARGGGIYVSDAVLNITNSCFTGNGTSGSSGYGGAIGIGDNATVTINNCSFSNNTANSSSADGGAIGVVGYGTAVDIDQCSFTSNTAIDDGNAIYLDRRTSGGTATISVDESIFGASQTVYRRPSDGANSTLTVINSGTRQIGSGSDPIAGNDLDQNLGAPSTNCPSVASPCNLTILPVEFIDFTIVCQGEKTQFNWSTATERNNDYFTIEYSNDFINWNQVLREKGKGTTQLKSDYSVELENARSGYYKLSQVDTDGKVNELKTAYIRNCAKGFSVYPNPSHDEVTISLVGFDKNVTIQVYNTVGVLVYENEAQTENELYSGKINLRELANGAYIIRAFDGLNNYQEKIIKN